MRWTSVKTDEGVNFNMKHVKQDAYAQAGVDIDAGAELVERIKAPSAASRRPGVMSGLGGFGAFFDPRAAGFHDPILVSTTDGVGTKLKIAIDTGNHKGIGQDLVAMCVNDLIVQGAEPLFFLDYFATGKLEVDQAAQVIAGIAKACEDSGCALVGGETAEMPGMYHKGDYDLAGFAVGAVERGRQITGETIQPGDVVLGLASSGVHSNGFSLVRKIAADAGLDWSAPAPFDAKMNLGDALLTPTRLYVKPVLAAIRAGLTISGIVHITGGGLSENIPRVLPAGWASGWTPGAGLCRRFSAGSNRRAASATRIWGAPSTAGSACASSVRLNPRRNWPPS